MPSEKTLQQKQQVVDELTKKFQAAKSVILADYRGLTVEQDTELRNQLRKENVEYKVIKNTVTRFAARNVGIEGLDPYLNGPSSVAISFADPVAPAKILSEFAKKNENLKLKVGVVDGKIVDVNGIKVLASLPPKEVLIAKVLGGFNAPISGLVNVLNGNIRGLAVALNAVLEKRQQEA